MSGPEKTNEAATAKASSVSQSTRASPQTVSALGQVQVNNATATVSKTPIKNNHVNTHQFNYYHQQGGSWAKLKNGDMIWQNVDVKSQCLS